MTGCTSTLPLLALRGGSALGGASALLAGALSEVQGATKVAPSIADTIAGLLGYLMMAGAMLVYSPMIVQVVKTKSGEGLSRTAWGMSVIGFGGALCYQLSKGYPISTFGELIALTTQSVLLFSLMQYFDRSVSLPAIAGQAGKLPQRALFTCQACSPNSASDVASALWNDALIGHRAAAGAEL